MDKKISCQLPNQKDWYGSGNSRQMSKRFLEKQETKWGNHEMIAEKTKTKNMMGQKRTKLF
jgi:hypothetical protein